VLLAASDDFVDMIVSGLLDVLAKHVRRVP
jgi:hypothetical protein